MAFGYLRSRWNVRSTVDALSFEKVMGRRMVRLQRQGSAPTKTVRSLVVVGEHRIQMMARKRKA